MAIFPEDYSRKVTPANGDFVLLGDSEDNDKIKYGLYSDFKGEKGDSFNWLGAYNAGTTYNVNDAISYGSKSYVCILESTGNLPTDTTYRGQIAAGILWRGTYAGGTAYAVNDAVYYSSKSYICKVASTGNLPTDTTYWDVLADLAPIDTSDRTYFVDQPYYVYTPAYLTGGTSAESSTVVWDSVTDGEFAISIDGVAHDITGLDFSSITDMAGVATVIQTGIRAATTSTETCVWSTDHFVISSADTTTSSAITVTSAVSGGTGTDISGVGTVYMDCESGQGTVTAKAAGATSNEDKVPIILDTGALHEGFTRGYTGTVEAGEDIDAGESIYISTVDGKAYLTDGTDAAKLPDIPRISIVTVVTGETVLFNYMMPTRAISGMTIGREYYVSDTPGAISLTPGTYEYKLGTALETDILNLYGHVSYTPKAGTSNTAGEDLTEETVGVGASYIKTKEITVTAGGEYSVSWEMKQTGSTTYGRVYKNGVAIGVDNSTSSATYVAYSEDFTFEVGDLVQLYTHATSGDGAVQNYKVTYDAQPIIRGTMQGIVS